MKMKTPSERGQALILIVFAVVGLIGLTALAVDGGNAYAERRRAQNAADTTALDAALAKVRGQNLYNEGLARAASNNYADSDATAGSSLPNVNVEIYNPPISGAYLGDNEYIQVFITATIDTYFGRVVGIPEVTNKVDAVARAKPPIISPIWTGNAVVSLSEHDCKAVVYQGNANTTITGGGIFVNSDCASSAFFNNSSAALLSTPCLQAVGGITYDPGAINTTIPGCIYTDAAPLPPIIYPNPTCSGSASQNGNILNPGNFSGTFPPAGVDTLEPGIYCVDGEFRMNAGDVLMGSDVVIVMVDGDVTWNGGATLQLDAPDSGPYDGLLLFVPESNSSTIKINGNSDSTFTGSILAPTSDISINGTGDASGMNCQVIGYTVDLSGDGATLINYDADDNYPPIVNPQIELVE